MAAGAQGRRPGAYFIDVLASLDLIALLALWALCVRSNGFFLGTAFLFLGLPLLFADAAPLRSRTASTIGRAVHDAIGRAVNRSVT